MGVSWDQFWDYFCDFSLIWGAKVGDSFQVHLFSDLGLEMVPESGDCMCYNHCKKLRFLHGFVFSTYLQIWCLREGLGSDFGVFW